MKPTSRRFSAGVQNSSCKKDLILLNKHEVNFPTSAYRIAYQTTFLLNFSYDSFVLPNLNADLL